MTPRILIADDNRADIDLILLAFEEAGLKAFIVAAQDGEDVLEKAVRCQPHLILLDINMPRADGFEVLRRLRLDQAFAGLPVIMMSSSASPFDQARAQRMGVICYWIKPIHFREWVALVRRLPSLSMVFAGADGLCDHDVTQASPIRPIP